MRNQQHTPEPFGFFKAEPFGWTDCAETDEGAQPLFDQAAIDAQRDELISDLSTAEQDSRQKQARIDRLERERDELLANSRTCNWGYDEDDGYWAGDCGIAFCIEEETPSKNNMNYCPKCGGKLVEFIKVKGGAA